MAGSSGSMGTTGKALDDVSIPREFRRARLVLMSPSAARFAFSMTSNPSSLLCARDTARHDTTRAISVNKNEMAKLMKGVRYLGQELVEERLDLALHAARSRILPVLPVIRHCMPTIFLILIDIFIICLILLLLS